MIATRANDFSGLSMPVAVPGTDMPVFAGIAGRPRRPDGQGNGLRLAPPVHPREVFLRRVLRSGHPALLDPLLEQLEQRVVLIFEACELLRHQ